MLTHISYILHTAVQNVQIVQIAGGLQLCDCTSTGSAGAPPWGTQFEPCTTLSFVAVHFVHFVHFALSRYKMYKMSKRHYGNQAVTVAQLVGRCCTHVRCGVRRHLLLPYIWYILLVEPHYLQNVAFVKAPCTKPRQRGSIPAARNFVPTYKMYKMYKIFFFWLVFPTFDRHPCMI